MPSAHVSEPELAVVVPVYNEAAHVVALVTNWVAALDGAGVDFVLHLYDDGSSDATPALLADLARADARVVVHHHANRGHGPTLVGAYQEQRGATWVFQLDADDRIGPGLLLAWWPGRDRFDLHLASRHDPQRSWFRRALTGTARAVVRLIHGRGVRDVNAPYRLFRMASFAPLVERMPADLLLPNIMLAGAAAQLSLGVREDAVAVVGRSEHETWRSRARWIRLAAVGCAQLLTRGTDWRERVRGAGVALLLAACLLVSGTWSRVIPFDQAPDEWTHVHYNIRPMLSGRLPVMGVDDVSAAETANPRPTGRLVARYSYVNTPAPYLGAALGSWMGTRWLDADPLTGARAFSLVCLAGALLGIYAGARTLGARPAAALAGAAWVGAIPQVLFLGAYVNQEAFSLAMASVLAWATARDVRARTWRTFAGVGAATGAVLLGKVSFWVLAPAAGGWMLWRIRRAAAQDRARLTAAALVPALLVCAAPLGRNIWLYGSPTGLGHAVELMRAAQGLTIEPQWSMAALRELVARDFVGLTARSAVMTFDHMSLLVPVRGLYRAVDAGVAIAAVVVVAGLVRRRDRPALAAAAALGVGALVVGGLHVYNAVVYDFQPQGRYLFALLPPAGVYAGWLAGRHRFAYRSVWMVAAGLTLVTGLAHRTVTQEYAAYNVPTVAAARRLAVAGGAPAEHVFDLVVDRPGLTAVTIRRGLAPAYDVAFHGIEVIDRESGTVLRRAFVAPWEWRQSRVARFRFRPLAEAVGAVRLRLFSEHGGVHPLLLDGGCESSPPSASCVGVEYY